MSFQRKMKSFLRNIVLTMQTLREDAIDFARSRIRPLRIDLNTQEMTCVNELRQQGFTVVKGYWPREKALYIRDVLVGYLGDGRDRDLEKDAYLRSDAHKGIAWIYHVERLVDELRHFRNESLVFRVADGYYGIPFYSGVLAFQHTTQGSTDPRHHRDSFGKQFKAFLYLDDVDEGDGPLTYLRGTHRMHFIRLQRQIFGRSQIFIRFSEDDPKTIFFHEVKIYGPAGTLVLADVRGLHCGLAPVNRSRSVLVNYMYKTPGDVYPDR